MKRNAIIYAHLLGLALLTASCTKDKISTATPQISISDKYTINTVGLYPEGVDYDMKNNRFFLGSFNQGTISALALDGKLTSFTSDTNLVAVTGVYTDEERNRLIVVSGDAGASQKSTTSSAGSKAYVGVYELSSGSLIKGVDLKALTPDAGAFPNDIAIDKDGNIYITDSFSPIIYKLNETYAASVFVSNDLFKPAANSFGLNGIVYHPDGYLLVAKTDNNKLFKISIANPSTNIAEVTGISVNTPDGLEWTKDNKLVIVENGLSTGKVYTYASANNWTSANKDGELLIGKDEFPTTVALAANNKVYVLSSKLGKLLSGDKTQTGFSLQKVN